MRQEELRSLQPQLFEKFSYSLKNNRLSHAYLFSGSFASFEMALFLSQAIFCEDKKDSLPCGRCRSCRLIEENNFADLTILSPQGNLIKTETVRELVRDFTQSGFESSQQVFIIREAEKMHVNAANSLLKAMEEPESDMYLFLLTQQEERVLPTIKSRAQVVDFPKNQKAIEHRLQLKGILPRQASMIARLAKDFSEAEQMIEKKTALDLLARLKKWLDKIKKGSQTAYVEIVAIQSMVNEKADQELVFDILTLLLSEEVESPFYQEGLLYLLEAKKMWQSNVSFQNSLEYWFLKTVKK